MRKLFSHLVLIPVTMGFSNMSGKVAEYFVLDPFPYIKPSLHCYNCFFSAVND